MIKEFRQNMSITDSYFVILSIYVFNIHPSLPIQFNIQITWQFNLFFEKNLFLISTSEKKKSQK